MEKIIEHYQQFSEAERAVNLRSNEAQSHAKGPTSSRTNSELLEIAQRSFDESNLTQLGMNKLEQIEEELDEALRATRSRKKQLMTSMMAKLHEKANTLLEETRRLESLHSGVAQEAASIEKEKEKEKEAGRQDDDENKKSGKRAGNAWFGLPWPPAQELHLLADCVDPK